jgi:hypothetical protein
LANPVGKDTGMIAADKNRDIRMRFNPEASFSTLLK